MGSVWGAPSGQILGFEAQGRRDAGSSRPRGLLSSILPSYRSYSVTRLAVYCTMLPRLDTASPRMEATPPHPRVNPRAMEGRGSKRTTDGGGHTAGVPCTSAQVRPVLENPLWLPSPARRRRSSPYPPPPPPVQCPHGRKCPESCPCLQLSAGPAASPGLRATLRPTLASGSRVFLGALLGSAAAGWQALLRPGSLCRPPHVYITSPPFHTDLTLALFLSPRVPRPPFLFHS